MDTAAGKVSVVVDGPPQPRQLLVLAHGAGAGLDSDFMAFFAERLTSDDRAVARFNFVYMEQGRKSPGPAKVSEQTFVEVLEQLRTTHGPEQLFVGGKSYGGRMASHVAAAGEDVEGLVFLGYPLHAPGKPDNMRDDHLYGITAPMLFVQGTRDAFCPLDTLARVRAKIHASDLVTVEGGDHSLKVPKSSGRKTEDAWTEAADAIGAWLER